MNETIHNYLSGPRPYAEGVALYRRYGLNPALKHAFATRPESRLMRLTLYEELSRLERLAPPSGPEPANSNPQPTVTPVTPEETRKIRFRDRFPFLKQQDCPDVLKLLVADMFTSYEAYRTAHNTLAALPADTPPEQAAPLARTAVEEMLLDRLAWAELEHYQEHHALLGLHPRVKEHLQWMEYRALSDFDLMQRRKNAASNVSKAKAKLNEAEAEEERAKYRQSLREWQTVKDVCDHEIERRKKGGA